MSFDNNDLEAYGMTVQGQLPEPLEPQTYEQAMNGPYREQWIKAMQEEMKSLSLNCTWEEVPRTQQMNVLSGKWVFKIKRGPNGEISRFKARWVVRGFEQQQGIDFSETFASVVRQKTYRVLFALAAIHDWEIEQMDVKTAFLYGPIDTEVFVELPTGFTKDGTVCRLRKALYGLKQALRIWY